MRNPLAASRIAARYGTFSSERREQKELTRARLLKCGCDLFITRGFSDTSIEQIAAGAGVTRATFYLHFDSKQSIVDALRTQVTRHLDAEYDRLATMQDAGPTDIRAWISDFLNVCRRDRRIVLVLVRCVPADNYRIYSYDYYDSVMLRLGSGLKNFAAASADHSSQLRATAQLLLWQLEAIVRHWIMDRDRPETAALVNVFAEHLYKFINE